jgi:glucokinase
MIATNNDLFLAGDVGGTKTLLALVDEVHGARHPLVEERYESADYATFIELIQAFVGTQKYLPLAASIGVAGPVHDNRVEVTNLPWEIDANRLSEALSGASVSLLNDLEAIAHAIPALDEKDSVVLKAGEPEVQGAIAIVAPGTGLGEAYLFWDGNGYRPVPSEGGHTDFAPATPLEVEMLTYLMPRLGHVSYERVCSGVGIPNIYSFLKHTRRYDEPDWLSNELAQVDDQTPIIVQSAIEKSAEISVVALDLFMSILGSEAGNLVLQAMTTGGVYLAGGIPPRIIDQLKGKPFLESFTRKGRLSDILHRVPIRVIVNRKAALYGAANHCLKTFSKNPA